MKKYLVMTPRSGGESTYEDGVMIPQSRKRKLDSDPTIAKKVACDVDGCTYRCTKASELTRHKLIHSDTRPFICTTDGCNSSFKTPSNLRQHQRTHTGEKKFVCDFDGCQQSFCISGNLKRHKSKHFEERPYICHVAMCEAAFKTPEALKKHQAVYSDDRLYACEFEGCLQSFKRADYLREHKNVHSVEKRYMCDFNGCELGFNYSEGLKIHRRIHTKENLFFCTIEDCKASFRKAEGLKIHQRTHTGEKSFACDFTNCNKKYSMSGALVVHKRSHTNERPFLCDVDGCEMAFVQSSSLIIHKRTHSGARPYKCTFPECDQAFSASSTLKNHKFTHSEEKKFACEHCSLRTNRLGYLKKHIELHETQKSYEFECKMQDHGTQLFTEGDVRCTIRCKTAKDLDVHIERNHTKEGIAKKFQSEESLAKFLQSQSISFDRDWTNNLNFNGCKNIEGGKTSARPDFFLPEESAKLNAIVLVGNDEFAHRFYPCDFQRIFNIANSLEQNPNYQNVPLLYIRFNPHHFQRDGTFYSPKLEVAHNLLLSTLQSIKNVKPGVNLVYVNYDRTDGQLNIFKPENSEENDFVELYKNCVLLDV